jgi:hypothetical protein
VGQQPAMALLATLSKLEREQRYYAAPAKDHGPYSSCGLKAVGMTVGPPSE